MALHGPEPHYNRLYWQFPSEPSCGDPPCTPRAVRGLRPGERHLRDTKAYRGVSGDPVTASRPRPAAPCPRGRAGRGGGALGRVGAPLAPRSRANTAPARPGRRLHVLPPVCNAASLRAAHAPQRSAETAAPPRPFRLRSVPTAAPRGAALNALNETCI